ncbi:hypothetical protein HYQ45_002922 [Verticillium longisporum]|uniref:Uncharacterized protein n=1 Tax=Verticillium longisporum TaxID=100787 RepID=A0A8I2ZYH6_VERLO|nr:hypothetical protein HYQ45_002922 [Verticillium longisporum]
MASFIAKFITKKILKERVQNNFGTEDPYFETVPATRLDGKPTDKVKKRPKALPPGVSKHDGKVLTKVKRRAWRLDMCLFSLCGVRFGWGSAIGLIPAIGDAIDALMALMVFRTCYPSDSVIFDQRRRDDPDSDGSAHVDRQPQRNGTMSSRPDGSRRHGRTAEPTVPANAKVRDTGRSSWFNFGRGRATDLEAGGDNNVDRSTIPTRHQSNIERRREI